MATQTFDFVKQYVIKYPENSAANIYGASTVAVKTIYTINAPPTKKVNKRSSATVTGIRFVRFASALTPINKRRAAIPRPSEKQKA